MNISDFYTSYFQAGNISTDTRKIKPGDIFIGLKGDTFNGSDYAEQAIKSGARIAVVDHSVVAGQSYFYKVNNTLNFLQKLANHHRNKCKAHIIGLTGSNGKTTTKELLHSVLSVKYKTQATEGNLNNHIGVPLTLLSIRPETEIAIIEMGANHPGEIKALCEIADPDSGLITNIGRAHLEGFGGFEGVKKTKAELYDYIKQKKGKLYYNASDPTLCELIDNYSLALRYNSNTSICKGKIISSLPELSIELTDSHQNSAIIISNLFGEYNFTNIIAASCIGLDFGINLIEMISGIEKYLPSNLRSQVITLPSVMLILDCYNANPTSMHLALQEFSKLKHDNKLVIVGGMKELGEYTAQEHEFIASVIDAMNVKNVILIGDEFKKVNTKKGLFCTSISEIIDFLSKTDLKNSAILIKGSRANQLEKVGDYIKTRYARCIKS